MGSGVVTESEPDPHHTPSYGRAAEMDAPLPSFAASYTWRMRRRATLALTTLPLLALTGCMRVGYYGHLAQGQWALLQARVPIDRLLTNPDTDPTLAARLGSVLDARGFAVSHLGLPDNGSYTQYADLHRDAVVWNLFATPRHSLAPREVCHPMVGCLAYQGFFDLARAEREAEKLRKTGLDTYIAPVPAYSTLGWFDDPVLNTMMGWSTAQLVGTVFHELAHQQVFVADDTAFNESYASFVEEAGLQAWMAARHLHEPDWALLRARRQAFVQLVLDTRARLAADYERHQGRPERLEAARNAAFTELEARYQALRADWDGWAGYDRWFSSGLNNAKLLPFGLYDGWTAAFAALFRECDEDWPRFHAAVAALAALPESERQQRLETLQDPR